VGLDANGNSTPSVQYERNDYGGWSRATRVFGLLEQQILCDVPPASETTGTSVNSGTGTSISSESEGDTNDSGSSEGEEESEEEEQKTCEDTHSDIKECFEWVGDSRFDRYAYGSMNEALRALERILQLPPDNLLHQDDDSEEDSDRGPCVGFGGRHWNVFDRRDVNRGSVGMCPCCVDGDSGPEIEQHFAVFPAGP
jgi:hypothetical protein